MNERKTWEEARRNFQSMGADLASISSESENMFIREVLRGLTPDTIPTEGLFGPNGFFSLSITFSGFVQLIVINH